MDTFLTKKVAVKMMWIGAIVWVLTFVASFVSIWLMYGAAGAANGNDVSRIQQTAQAWQYFSKANLFIQQAAFYLFCLGVINMIIVKYKAK